MKPMIVYVSGPYSAPTREARLDNVLEAVEVGIEIRKKGHFPVIPHLYDLFDEIAKKMGHNFDWQSYIDMDLAILERCDALYFIGESKGACIELERAKELGLKIFYSLEEVPKVKDCGKCKVKENCPQNIECFEYDNMLEMFDLQMKFAVGEKKIYLLVGPSGSGKTTLAQYFKELGIPELISHTTRLIRPGELQGETYYFVKHEDFAQIETVESTEYNFNLYGTSRAEVERVLSSNGSALAIVDKAGVEQFRALYSDLVKVIYIYVPVKLAVERMRARGDSEDDIADRIRHAFRSGEFDNLEIADYCIVNKELDASLRQLIAIVRED